MALILTGPNSRLQPAVSLETYSHPPPPLLILCELENGTVCDKAWEMALHSYQLLISDQLVHT